MIKWVWKFLSQKDSLWTKVIVAIHGVGGKIHSEWTSTGKSCWLSILSEVRSLQRKGMYVFDYLTHKMGNGESTKFWLDHWHTRGIFKDIFPRLYALESSKDVTVSSKIGDTSLVCSFRRIPRGGIEQNQFDSLVELVRSVTIVPSADRWNWNLESTGIFSVASARRRIDEICLPNIGEETRWVKCVPIKINVLAWKIKTDALPTRFNISRRGIDIQDMSCPICDNAIESTDHLFFRCGLVRDIANKVLSWWNLDHANLNSYAEWKSWLVSIRMDSKLKKMFEGVWRSKGGKRFSFVRFIKVFNIERLVNNLCTVWVGRHKIHANLARFQRAPLNKSYNQPNNAENRNNIGAHKDKGLNESTNSYAHVVKGSKPQYVVSDNIPVLTLDDSCLNQQNYTCCLMGKVKEFASLSNLKMVLANEGFNNIELRYMGGYWVMIKLHSEEAKEKFQSNVGIGSWFTKIQQASNDFMVDGRVAWVELEGIPLNLWSENTFKCIASKWGSLIHAMSRRMGVFTQKEFASIRMFQLTFLSRLKSYTVVRCVGCVPKRLPDFMDENDTDIESNEKESIGDELKNDTKLEGDIDAEVIPDTKFDDVILNAEEPSVGHKEMRSRLYT
ncbi:RNA-directed DNA polymerase, eukaryota, reverse transcriptase zinc-binding domain protein [Tanacetum coccineum]